MKLSLLFVAILGVATVAAVPASKVLNRSTRSLSDDWAEFHAIVEADEIIAHFYRYLEGDLEVQYGTAHFRADGFIQIVDAVEALPEYIAFLNYLEANGLGAYNWVNRLHAWLDIPALIPPSRVPDGLEPIPTMGGYQALWADIKPHLHLPELLALYYEKLETSPDFAHFVSLLSSDDAKVIYQVLWDHPMYQDVRQDFVDLGFDIDGLFEFLKKLINYS